MVGPAVLIIALAFYVTFAVIRSIQQFFRHRQNAKALHCQPAPQGRAGFFGIPAFLKVARAVREKRLVEFMTEQYGIYGNTFEQKVFGRYVVTTIEPENIKALLATQFSDFRFGNRHREFYPLLGDGIFTLDGAGWSHARALLRPQFTKDQVADLAMMDGHIMKMIDIIPKDGSVFDIQKLFFLLTMDSATHFLFGESVGSLSSSSGVLEKSTGGAQGFADAFNLAQEYLAARSRAQAFYFMVNTREFREATRKVHNLVDHYVQLALQSRNKPSKPDDRYIFLQALAEDSQNPKVLRDNLLNILLAGRDTTASLLSSTFFLFARHPHVWHKLRREVIREFGDCNNKVSDITHAKLKDMPYLRHVLNEVLRLYPPVPINFRVSATDTSLPVGGGPDGKSPMYIRKDSTVAYVVYGMHRRKDLWGPDAESFRPERWEENGKHGWEYLPFNGGPRICLGQQYALTEASYTIVKLMQHFDTVENADPHLEKPVLISSLTMSHDRGVNIRLYNSGKSSY
ncbi:cytochrome P450 alkane hydroxylase, putative [Paecilomyces variotii No. 5]|uniref:Cytochrome P450 alkane hydroxylase, putative n=1 Tax=Byssochlamys spectabilis (strain No. 5 / NBRC 109023) TaxID=1356009 RepID=V5G4E7_BYSSN|nr:cytochrome P450 alkane hydroxylase, putative [Paecilomyces variotii No. 5]